jgi:hypothetical protein
MMKMYGRAILFTSLQEAKEKRKGPESQSALGGLFLLT